MDDGSWVIFELPGFATAAAGAEQGSLAALRDASDTSYYKDDDTLWVKLVVDNSAAEVAVLSALKPASTSADKLSPADWTWPPARAGGFFVLAVRGVMGEPVSAFL
jgi:hypothetical protein